MRWALHTKYNIDFRLWPLPVKYLTIWMWTSVCETRLGLVNASKFQLRCDRLPIYRTFTSTDGRLVAVGVLTLAHFYTIWPNMPASTTSLFFENSATFSQDTKYVGSEIFQMRVFCSKICLQFYCISNDENWQILNNIIDLSAGWTLCAYGSDMHLYYTYANIWFWKSCRRIMQKALAKGYSFTFIKQLYFVPFAERPSNGNLLFPQFLGFSQPLQGQLL